MGANKEKQNLRYKKVCERLDKKISYKGFTDDEVKLIKAHEKYKICERTLNDFWKTAPRKSNNSVDWETLSEQELDYFEHINKESEKTLKRISKLEDKGLNSDTVMYNFMLVNVKSVCF
jgi:hypothetical protein